MPGQEMEAVAGKGGHENKIHMQRRAELSRGMKRSGGL